MASFLGSLLAAAVTGAALVSAAGGATVRPYGQCGGADYRGPTGCATGTSCVAQSRFINLCLPNKPMTTTSPPPASTPTSSPPVPEKPKYLITFGDSYSQTGFNITLAKPSASNPIGNPPLPGWTASGGLNWVGFLASQYNAANPLLTYNFAYGGATTNATLVTPWKPEVLSFIDQVAEFSGSIGAKPKPEYAPWTGEDALVGVWMGVNDVGNSWWLGNYDALLEQIMDSYFGQLQIVYEAGARNFVLLTVPPIHKTPAILANPADAQANEAVSIKKYNDAIAARLRTFETANAGVTAKIVDTTLPFNTAIENPTKYGAPNATCYNSDGVSCLWFNDYHPGVAVNKLVAEAVASAWKGKFFKVK